MSVTSNPVTTFEKVIVTGIGLTFVGDVAEVVIVTVGTALSKVYVSDFTADRLPARSHVMAFSVVVAAGIVTLVGSVADAVPVEQVGSVLVIV